MKRFVSLLLVILTVLACTVSASARLVGDVNSDGRVNSMDALYILRKSVGLDDGVSEIYMDVNGDGRINSLDALTVLMISVGRYDGETEVEDGLVTSYKAQLIDPVMETGRFTFTTEVVADGTVRTATAMIRNNDICVETGTKEITMRVLCLDGKTYLVFPFNAVLYKGFYAETQQEISTALGSPEKVEYVGSEKVKVDGVEYIREGYRHADGSVTDYYFKDGKWMMIGAQTDGETEIRKIVDFRSGVDESYFSLDGYREVELEEITKK